MEHQQIKQFTKYQIDEIIPLIEIRRDTIAEDPDSAWGEESREWLDALEAKIGANTMDFTEAEKVWLRQELNDRISVGYGNLGYEEKMEIRSFISSMQNALSKLD